MTHQTTDEIDVTVIVPIYHNAAQNLSRCLDSIVGQTLKTVEILLLCDDNLLDSIDICNKYASNDRRISVIRLNGLNKGEACNQGINKSNGKYITFVEPNDWIEPEMCQSMLERAERYDTDVTIAYHYDVHIENNKKQLNKDLIWDTKVLERKLTEKFDIPNFYLRWPYCWGYLYKSDFINLNKIKFCETESLENTYYDMSFAFLVFLYMESYCLVRGTFYNHSLPTQDIIYKNPYIHAVNTLSIHYYILNLAQEKKAEIRFIQLEMASAIHDIIKYNKCLTSLTQRIEYLSKASELLKKYSDFYVRNQYISLDEKKLINKYAYKPGLSAFLDKKNTHIKLLRLIFNIQIKDKVTHIKILNFPVLFIKNTHDYKTFNIFMIPIRRKRITKNFDGSMTVHRIYYFGLRLFKKTFSQNEIKTYFLNVPVWREVNIEEILKGITKRLNSIPEERDVLFYACMAADIARTHSQIFPQFKNSNKGKNIAIFGAGPTANYAPELKESKIIACNRAYEFFLDSGCDYFFGQDYYGIRPFYYKAIKNSTYAFIGRNANKDIGVPPEQYRNLENLYSYYFRTKIYNSAIKPNIESFPLADFYTVVHPALHFALYTNPDTIYLIGCDTTTEGYANKNVLQFKIHIEEIKRGYQKLKELRDLEYPDTRIISVNPVGLRGIFEDVYTEEFLTQEPDLNRTNITIIKEI